MKTALQTALAPLTPSINISIFWEHDDDTNQTIFNIGNGLDGENPNDWQAWQSEVRASAIVGGELVTGSAYLGGTWEKYGDKPWETNPTISGYENHLTREALEELVQQLPGENVAPLDQIAAALEYCKAESIREHEEQRAASEAAASL